MSEDATALGAWVVSLAGTPAGERWAVALALVSAVSHALFGAINKTGDPFLNRGAINITYAAFALPVALFVTPWPSAALWPVILASFVVHLIYEMLQALSFHRGAYTLVYPIARGSGPLLIAAAATVLFGEALGAGQWLGMAVLSGAIFGLAAVNLRGTDAAARGAVLPAVWAALGTGVMIAVYTLVDAYGMRVAEDPFTFLAWMFLTGIAGSPVIAFFRWRRMPVKPAMGPIVRRGLLGALVAYASFGSLMLATRLDKVGEAAALRETSIAVAAAIGWLWFGERIGALRLSLISLIVVGALMVELA